MTPQDIEAYKKELMKLYSKNTNANTETTAENTADEKEDIPQTEEQIIQEIENIIENDNENNDGNNVENNIESDTENNSENDTENNGEFNDTAYDDSDHDSSYFPYTGDEGVGRQFREEQLPQSDEFNEADEMPIEEDIVLPSEITQPVPDDILGSQFGTIIVNVRTGNESSPIVNASVVVTAIIDGRRLFITAGQTDISGNLTSLEVPAPDARYSQSPDPSVRPYSLFDISVKANGFFDARSVDVPVFAGVTSIQNFNMIPLPLGSKSTDETLTYFNQEPNF